MFVRIYSTHKIVKKYPDDLFQFHLVPLEPWKQAESRTSFG